MLRTEMLVRFLLSFVAFMILDSYIYQNYFPKIYDKGREYVNINFMLKGLQIHYLYQNLLLRKIGENKSGLNWNTCSVFKIVHMCPKI